MLVQIDSDVDVSGKRAVETLLALNMIQSVRYVATTASTNSMALADLQANALGPLPQLYLTDCQTAGRGRHGRQWISDDSTLTFSLVIEPAQLAGTEQIPKALSLLVGVAVARAIEFATAPLQTKLKWPNDVYAGGGKVAGVLLETNQYAAHKVVIGIGVNVRQSPCLTDLDAAPICSIAEASKKLMERYDLLPMIVAQVLEAVSEPADAVRDFRQRCMLSGQVIRYRIGDHEFEANCQGISDAGELIVETNDGSRRLSSGEVKLVRPR
jgi:BirA family transcriptional regulator, biotin operon repressor / biotin---[acetyl-CoA-carboxylase] ligase